MRVNYSGCVGVWSNECINRCSNVISSKCSCEWLGNSGICKEKMLMVILVMYLCGRGFIMGGFFW